MFRKFPVKNVKFHLGTADKRDMSSPTENQLKFNPDIAKQLLQTIDKITIEIFPQPPSAVDRYQIEDLMPTEFENVSLKTILWNLYILSISGYIHPPISLDTIRSKANSDKSGFHFLVDFLRDKSVEYILTAQGYEYLQNHTQ